MNTLISLLLATLAVLVFVVLLACDGRLMEGQSLGGCIFVFVVAFIVSRFFSGKTSKKGDRQ